jgi:hypothetical protein
MSKLEDKAFLVWVYERLCNVYKEDKDKDYMKKLWSIISEIDTTKGE